MNGQDDFPRDFFIYSAEFLPLNASASATVRIQLQADSDFLLAMIVGDVRDNDTDETVIAAPAISIELLSSSSGRLLQDRAVMWDNLVGTAERPFILPAPKTFPANSIVSINVTNFVAAAKRVRLSLEGYKIFPGMS